MLAGVVGLTRREGSKMLCQSNMVLKEFAHVHKLYAMATTFPGKALERVKGGGVAPGWMLSVAIEDRIDELLCGGSWNVVGIKTVTAYERVGMWLRIERNLL